MKSDINRYPEYDSFEREASMYFNSAYFQGTCSEFPNDFWFIRWVDAFCPEKMSQNRCSSQSITHKEGICITTCKVSPWTSEYCCPSKDDCNGGLIKACPYEQCRIEALKKVLEVLK